MAGMTVKNDGDLPKVLTGIMISDGSLFNREIVRGLLGNSDEYIPRDNLSADEDVDCYDMVKLIVRRHPTWHAHALFGGSFVGIAGGFIAHDTNAEWLENIIGSASLGLFVFGFRSVHNRAQLINEFTKVCLQKNPYYRPRWKGLMREAMPYQTLSINSAAALAAGGAVQQSGVLAGIGVKVGARIAASVGVAKAVLAMIPLFFVIPSEKSINKHIVI